MPHLPPQGEEPQMTPTKKTDGRADAPAPPTGPERFEQYTIRRDPVTGTALVNITEAPYGAWDEYIGRRNDSYCVGKSEWANPFRLGEDGTREEVVEKYRDHLRDYLGDSEAGENRLGRFRDLEGKTLACWCVGQTDDHTACHGDVILDVLAILAVTDEADAHVHALPPDPESLGGGA